MYSPKESQKVIVRHYEEGDEKLITELFKEVFDQTMTIEQWKWKYQGYGLQNTKSVVAINEDRRIIGHFGGIPVRIWFKGKVIVGYQGADVMIHEMYRGLPNKHGLYFRICRFFYENHPSFVYGFSNLDHLRLGISLGFFEKAVTVKNNTIRATRRIIPFYRLEVMDWEDNRINILWDKVSGSLGWGVVRDTDFLQWRYKNNPFRGYRLYGLRKRYMNDILGWVVLRKGSDDELWLIDMLFREGHMEDLLRASASMAFREGKKKIVFWLNSKYEESLRSIGAVSVERGTYITNCVWEKICDSSEMRTQLFFTMGDADFM